MATQADVRRIAMSFPGAEAGADHFAFSVENKGKRKGFVWVWMERITPKKPRVANPGVIAVRTASVGQRDALIAPIPRSSRPRNPPPRNALRAAVVAQVHAVDDRRVWPLRLH